MAATALKSSRPAWRPWPQWRPKPAQSHRRPHLAESGRELRVRYESGWNTRSRCEFPTSSWGGSNMFQPGISTPSGWWLTNPEKNMTVPIYGKIKHVPNHQPAILQNKTSLISLRVSCLSACHPVSGRCCGRASSGYGCGSRLKTFNIGWLPKKQLNI